MPRNVRNFWVRMDVDGRNSALASGPAGPGGGFALTVLMRERGCISDKVVRLRGWAGGDGKLYLDIDAPDAAFAGNGLRLTTER